MENVQQFSYEIQNRKLTLTIAPGANPNGLYAIIVIVREGSTHIGSVRFTIGWLDLLKHLDSWTPFIKASFELFKRRKCAERLFALSSISTKDCDLNEEFEFPQSTD